MSLKKGEVSTLFTVKDHGFYVQRWNIVTQYGTHIDAPIHFVENKRYLEDIDLKRIGIAVNCIRLFNRSSEQQ